MKSSHSTMFSAALFCATLLSTHLTIAAPINASELFSGQSVEAAIPKAAAQLENDPENAALKQLLVSLKKMKQREAIFAKEKNPEIAAKLSVVLRRFYYQYGLWASAENLDRRMLELKPGEPQVCALAESMLNGNRNEPALELLQTSGLSADNRAVNLLSALAHARIGQADAARKALNSTAFETYEPRELMLYARAAGCLGDAAMASTAVTKMLENAPAKESEMLRKSFQTSDFAPISQNADFQKALTTESKAGDGCGGCPNKGTSHCGGGCDE